MLCASRLCCSHRLSPFPSLLDTCAPGDKHLLTSKKQAHNKTAHYAVSTQRFVKPTPSTVAIVTNSAHYVGKVRSNFWGTYALRCAPPCRLPLQNS
jgi:hypothetical protein